MKQEMTNDKIPSQSENPNGLHQRYEIRKIVPNPKHDPNNKILSTAFGETRYVYGQPKYCAQEIDKDAEYFVLRLDEGGSDLKHIAACRVAIHAYAEAIKDHIPQLSKDLVTRYPLIDASQLNKA